MREKTNAIVEAVVKIMVLSILALIGSIILLGIFSWTDFKDLFLDLLGITIMCTCFSFFAFLFFGLMFSDSETSYTADLIDVPEEFENIYKTLYEKYLIDLEKIRKSIRIRKILGKFLIAIFMVYMLTSNYIVSILPEKGLITIAMLIILGVIELLLYKDNRADNKLYKQTYKKYVIKDLISMLNYNVSYEIENPKKLEYYKNKYIDARFWLDIYDFTAEDFIEGEIENCPVKISDVVVMKNAHKYRVIFEGIFAYVDYNKYIIPNIVISRRFLVGNNGETKVKVDNELFEKYFNVYSQNQEYAERLLKNGFLEMLLRFRMKYNMDFDVSLLEGKIYIKIYSFSIFEPEIFDKTNGKQDLYTHYCFARFILDLIKEIKIILDKN